MKTSLLLIVFVLILSGCAVPYVEPTGTLNATLLIKNEAKNATMKFATFDDGENCTASTVKRITLDSSGNLEIDPGKSFEIRIKPDEAFTLDASSLNFA